MTIKEKVLAMIQRLDDDVTYDALIDKLEFMKGVEQAIWEADHGMLIDDEEVWAQIEAEDAAENAKVDANGAARPARPPAVHRGTGVAKKRTKIRAKDQGGGKSP